jgi:hypothetical protein
MAEPQQENTPPLVEDVPVAIGKKNFWSNWEFKKILVGVLVVIVFVLWWMSWENTETMVDGDVDVGALEQDASWDSAKKSAWGSGVNNRQQLSQNQQLYGAEYGDWGQMAAALSLDPEVFDSHRTFTEDIGVANTGASMGVRSDPNDVNNWVGLRRPNYHDAGSADDTARQVPTSYLDQHLKQRPFVLT